MSRPGPMPRVPCYVCGDPATLADEQKGWFDVDCDRCGRLRVTGRAFVVFPPPAIRAFDRPWLSDKVRAIAPTPQDGHRRRIDELWLHHWRLVHLMKTEHGLSEAAALAHLSAHPDADLRDGSVLALL